MEPQNKYKNYIDLLRANYNLVLTGAPGTGKTYLAKEIAKEMGAEWEIVQFHPSYDYTDFVEGMRPKDDDNGNIGFERKDGIFKAFCGKALENYVDSMKSKETLQQEKSAQELLEDFIDEAMEKGIEFHTSGTNNRFYISDNKEYHIIIKAPDNEKAQSVILRKSELLTLLEKNIKIIEKKEIQNYFQRKYSTQQDSYTFVIYQILQKRFAKATKSEILQVTQKPYVFIIDEINRGETSKIFGELFYSIDPGYRGEKGRVNTQYQNMIEDGNVFQKGFYVPENVYIIGTMNDIDRSVESMDFAMRRRLAWKEVTAEESFESMIENDTEFTTLKNEIKLRMTKLNQAILKKELGLGKAYQIGAAYFRKVAKYAELDPEIAFDMLWDYHLSGLLTEYLRGNRNAAEQLQILHQAYNNKETENDALNEG
ncbi:MAG: AAA family ATPase [Prevotellaceae bacterium]|nr:AAA family ATPase [Prevotellaceae bacterium]